MVLGCQQLLEEGGRERGEVGGGRCAGAYADGRWYGPVVLEPGSRSARSAGAHLLGCGVKRGCGAA